MNSPWEWLLFAGGAVLILALVAFLAVVFIETVRGSHKCEKCGHVNGSDQRRE